MSGLDGILGAPETVADLCRDIVSHYESNRAGLLAGKAMIVAYSRPIAMKIYYELMRLRPEWTDKVGVVMTTSNQDPEEWFDVVGGKEHKAEIERRFKSDDGPSRSQSSWTCGSRASTSPRSLPCTCTSP